MWCPELYAQGPRGAPLASSQRFPSHCCLPFHQKSHHGWPSPIIRSPLSDSRSFNPGPQPCPRISASPPPVFFKTDRRLWGPRAEFSRATTTFEVLFHCGSVFIKAVVTSAIRLPCDCNSTARYNHSTTCVTTVGLPVVGCCTLRLT